MTIKVNNLTGGYGKKAVIHDISFECKPSEVVGLIGLNGAGKSTTIKHILGLLTPQQGEMSINNIDIKADIESYRRNLTYIPESPVLYDELTLEEHIYMTAMAYGIDKDTAMRIGWGQERQYAKQRKHYCSLIAERTKNTTIRHHRPTAILKSERHRALNLSGEQPWWHYPSCRLY